MGGSVRLWFWMLPATGIVILSLSSRIIRSAAPSVDQSEFAFDSDGLRGRERGHVDGFMHRGSKGKDTYQGIAHCCDRADDRGLTGGGALFCSAIIRSRNLLRGHFSAAPASECRTALGGRTTMRFRPYREGCVSQAGWGVASLISAKRWGPFAGT
jgi:hypothetical protein